MVCVVTAISRNEPDSWQRGVFKTLTPSILRLMGESRLAKLAAKEQLAGLAADVPGKQWLTPVAYLLFQ